MLWQLLFDHYDADLSGDLDKAEINKLLTDITDHLYDHSFKAQRNENPADLNTNPAAKAMGPTPRGSARGSARGGSGVTSREVALQVQAELRASVLEGDQQHKQNVRRWGCY